MFTNIPGKEDIQLNVELPDTEVSVQYPSSWFAANPDTKPIVHVYSNTCSELYDHLYPLLKSGKWDDCLVASFMISAIVENETLFTEVSNEDWVAQKLLIGEANLEVTPVSCLTLIDIGIKQPNPNLESDIPTRLAYFTGLISLYRRIISKDNAGVKALDLTTKLENAFNREPFNMSTSVLNDTARLVDNKNLTLFYSRVVCAVDMFYTKFPQGRGSMLRMSTLVSRYRGCVAITSITHACTTLGINVKELVQFMIHSFVAYEAIQTFKSGEHSEDKYGYFPYQLGMGLTEHSPYTLAANPSLTFYVRCLSSFGGSTNAPLSYVASNIKGVKSLIEAAFLFAKKSGRLIQLDYRFASSKADLSNWETYKRDKEDLMKNNLDDDEADDLVHITTTQKELETLDSRAALTDIQKMVDDVIVELQVEGLNHDNKAMLYGLANRFKGFEPNTVGGVIYENYGKKL